MKWATTLRRIDENELYPRFPVVTGRLAGPMIEIEGGEFLTFAPNDYLGLSVSAVTKRGAINAVRSFGAGPGSTCAVGGVPAIVRDLEHEIAMWTGFDGCVTFPTGYMANVTVIPALLRSMFSSNDQTEAIAFVDQRCHGSILDGCRLAGAKLVPYRHNSLEDLAQKAQRFPNARLVVTEGVFCLEGTIIDLAGYSELCERFGLMLMVDDAHGIGILGPNGGGVAQRNPSARGVDVYMGSMDKALGSTGGFLCGSKELIRYLRVACRSAILSSCLPVACAGAALAAVSEIRSNAGLRHLAIERARSLRRKLRDRGLSVLGDIDHPSVAVLIGEESAGIAIERRLWDLNIYQPVIRWPAVPHNASRFRLNVTARHRERDLVRIATALESACHPDICGK